MLRSGKYSRMLRVGGTYKHVLVSVLVGAGMRDPGRGAGLPGCTMVARWPPPGG